MQFTPPNGPLQLEFVPVIPSDCVKTVAIFFTPLTDNLARIVQGRSKSVIDI